jgi:hypothetical protein
MELTLFGFGCLGGALPDLIRLAQNRYKEDLPKYLWSGRFWLGFLALVGLGGLAEWLGGATGVKEALAFGYGGPELLSRLLSAQGTRFKSVTDIQRFWQF